MSDEPGHDIVPSEEARASASATSATRAAQFLAPIAVAAGTGAITGGPVGALIGATGAALERGLSFLIRRIAVVEDEAVATSGLTKDELVTHLVADEERYTVAHTVFNAAQTTHYEEKLRMFGRLLAHAATVSHVDIDEMLIYAHTLEELEAPHIEVLAYLHRAKRGDSSINTHPDYEGGVPLSELATTFPGVWLFQEAVMTRLRNNSLVDDPTSRTWDGIDNPGAVIVLSQHGANFMQLLGEPEV